MREFASLLCGTDFSTAAHEAADVAAALARRLDKPLKLVSVAEPAITGGVAGGLRAQAAALAREALDREAERLRADGASVETEFRSGLITRELVKCASRSGVGLIVVASHGHRALSRWWLGSVAESIAESAPVPTLVVRDAAPLRAWLRDERPLKIFVGTDFTEQSDAALAWVAELRKIAPCEVVAACVPWDSAPPQVGGLEYPEVTPDDSTSAPQLLRALRDKVTAILGDSALEVRVTTETGRVERRLSEMAQEARADLIVVGSHQWHGLDRLWHHSVSRGVLHHAPMNVACVPQIVSA